MRRNEIFWGGVLVILGGLFFLRTAGYLRGDVFGWFWPLFIMAIGAWILLGGFQGRGSTAAGHRFVVPGQGARQAALTVNHGVGRLELRAGAPGPDFLTGNSAPGLSHSSRLVGERLEVSVDAAPSVMPFIGPEGGAWILEMNPEISAQVFLNAGASQLDLDLTDLQVTQLDHEGGASSMRLLLPEHVDRFSAHLRGGASSIVLRVPDAVAARIVVSGPAAPTLDTQRFAAAGSGVYQTSGYDMAPRRAEITIAGGPTSIQVE